MENNIRVIYHCPMNPHSMQHSLIIHPYQISKADLNGYGILHGGRLLTLCDEVAYLSAFKHAGCDCLTRAVHRARFHRGVTQDETITITAITGLIGTSSIWINVNVTNADQAEVMDAVFVFAAINRDKKSIPVAAVIAETEAEKQLQQSLIRMRETLLIEAD